MARKTAFEALKISARHALTKQEERFCIVHMAMREDMAPEAYRRAFEDTCYEEDEDGNLVESLTSDVVRKRAGALLKKPYIIERLQEFRDARPADVARQVLAEAVLTGDATGAAAERLLKQEDKLGIRDASYHWAAIMVACGSEVEVLLDEACPHCGEQLEASVALEKILPEFKGSLPPTEVLEKTASAVEDYLEKVREDLQTARDEETSGQG